MVNQICNDILHFQAEIYSIFDGIFLSIPSRVSLRKLLQEKNSFIVSIPFGLAVHWNENENKRPYLHLKLD